MVYAVALFKVGVKSWERVTVVILLLIDVCVSSIRPVTLECLNAP